MANNNHRGKRQLGWGIHLFKVFLLLAKHHGSIVSPDAEKFQEDLETLLPKLENGLAIDELASELNKLIASTNIHLKNHMDATLYAPFPHFSFVQESRHRSGVMDQIDMVERTLSEAAHAEVLNWEIEGKYFADVLKVLLAVEKGELQPTDAMVALNVSIEKINATLPEEYRLPLIDLSDYEVPA